MVKNMTHYIQKNDYSCGVCCIQMVLSHFGITGKNINKVASHIDGTDVRQIEHQLRLHGLQVLSGNFKFDILRYFVNIQKKPVITCFSGHFVVVVGIENRSVYYMDPLQQEVQKISMIAWNRQWWDFDSIGNPYICWCIVGL